MGGPRKKIQELEDVKMVGLNMKTMIKWRQHESSIFKDFFATIRFRPNKTLIFALKNENGIVVTKKEKLQKASCKFYNKLYMASEDQLRREELKTIIFNSLPNKFSKAMNYTLA